VQVFIKPFSHPWVVITDPFESQDILLRRNREFDRAPMFGEIVGGLIPAQHSHMLSTDAQFRKNRALVNHLMAPTFIHEISAPEMHRAAEEMIRVWDIKCDQAAGRPFSAHHDLTYLALDAILAAVFGLAEEENVTLQRLREMQGWMPPPELASSSTTDADEPVPFPESEDIVPPISAAIITLSMSLTENQLSPAPALTAWVMRKFPYMRRAIAIKEEYVRRKVDECIPLIEQADGKDNKSPATTTQPRSAVHSVLLRERETAAKEGRKPEYHSRAIVDEFIGFLMAGHDTTATTMAWGVKLLSDNQGAQRQLRSELRAALPSASEERRAPTYAELAGAHVPYLDAVVEEVLRHANSIAFVVRRAMCDAPVLGRVVPRDTNVFLMANGAGYLAPNRPVEPDELRAPGARRGVSANAKALTGVWDDADIGAFKPERWLKSTEGTLAFDPMAGPSLPFGAGPRGCYGRRLALQALRIQIALAVWHFELRQCPAELSSYNSVQKFAREPTQCYVRLSRAEW
jgi:cytochrome P450